MTVSIVIFEKFKNDERLAHFMEALATQAPDHHVYADNVIFARHEGTSRELYEALTRASIGRSTDLIVIEAANVQDTSWSAQALAFDWLGRALPNWSSRTPV